jgi:hypothetical protein
MNEQIVSDEDEQPHCKRLKAYLEKNKMPFHETKNGNAHIIQIGSERKKEISQIIEREELMNINE